MTGPATVGLESHTIIGAEPAHALPLCCAQRSAWSEAIEAALGGPLECGRTAQIIAPRQCGVPYAPPHASVRLNLQPNAKEDESILALAQRRDCADDLTLVGQSGELVEGPRPTIRPSCTRLTGMRKPRSGPRSLKRAWPSQSTTVPRGRAARSAFDSICVCRAPRRPRLSPNGSTPIEVAPLPHLRAIGQGEQDVAIRNGWSRARQPFARDFAFSSWPASQPHSPASSSPVRALPRAMSFREYQALQHPPRPCAISVVFITDRYSALCTQSHALSRTGHRHAPPRPADVVLSTY